MGITGYDKAQLDTLLGDKLDQAAVDARVTAVGDPIYATPPAYTVGAIGDSITNNIGTLNNYQFSSGYWSWASALLGGRLRLTYLDGVAGSECTTAEWSTRIASLKAANTAWALIEIGTNDVAANATAQQIEDALTASLDALAGRRVIICTIPPRNGMTTAQIGVHDTVNTWIRQLPFSRKNVVVVDVAAYLTDPTAANAATYVAAYTTDGTHPNTLGCRQMGYAFLAALDRLLPPSGILTPQVSTANMLPASSVNWAGGTSAQPTGWVGTNTGLTWSQVSRSDNMPGVVQRVVVPAGGSCGIHKSINQAYAAGDRLVGYLEVLNITGVDGAPAANTQYAHIYVQAFTTAFGNAGTAATLYRLNTGVPNVPPVAGIWVTPTLVVPANGLQEVDLFIQLNGGGTYDLGRVGVVKVGASY